MISNAPKIIIAGAPASGKGTQCEYIREEFGVIHLSTGDILRKAVADGTELGVVAKEYMSKGALVPDDVIVDLILKRVKEEDCMEKGWLLDGFPRTLAQAEAMKKSGIESDTFVFLDVDDSVLVERVVGRRSDPVTGRIYHLTFSPPENEEIRSRLVHREDDTEEHVKPRLQAFHANMTPIKQFYRHQMITVNGNRHPTFIRNEIFHRVGRAIRKNVILVMGSPKSGKLSMCKYIAATHNYEHISPRDLMKHYRSNNPIPIINSPTERALLQLTEHGQPVPARMVAAIISEFMSMSDNKRIVLENYPSSMDELNAFYECLSDYCTVDGVIHLDCSEELANERRTSAPDDNTSFINKRFRDYNAQIRGIRHALKNVGVYRPISAALPLSMVQSRVSSIVQGIDILPPYERTLALIKPDAVAQGLVPDILHAISDAGLSVIALKFTLLPGQLVDTLYFNMKEKLFFIELKRFMTSGPVLVVLIEGSDAIRRWRLLIGPMDPAIGKEKAPKSLRAKYGTNMIENACHGSDCCSSAFAEIQLFVSNGIVDDPEIEKAVLTSEDTLALLKPAAALHNYSDLMSIVASHGFEVIGETKVSLAPKAVDEFYASQVKAPYYPALKDYLTSGSVIALHIRREAAIQGWRHLIGYADYLRTSMERPDAIRSLFGKDNIRNTVHGSESPAQAKCDIDFFFHTSKYGLEDVSKKPLKSESITKSKKKAKAPTPLSLSNFSAMHGYLSNEVDPVLRDLIQRILVERPKDVVGYAIKHLIEEQRMQARNSTATAKGNITLKPLDSKRNGDLKSSQSSPILPAIPAHPIFQDDSFYAQDDDTKNPTYNGKPLTLQVAAAEINRLKQALNDVSENVIAMEQARLEVSSNALSPHSVAAPPTPAPVAPLSRNYDILAFGNVSIDDACFDNAPYFYSGMRTAMNSSSMVVCTGNIFGNHHLLSARSQVIRVLNTMGVGYGVLGDRDFDMGMDQMMSLLQSSMTTWLCSNIVHPKTKVPILGMEQCLIVEWNGVKIGLLGMLGRWAVAKLGETNAKFLDIVNQASTLSEELKLRGAELVICLTHCDDDTDFRLCRLPSVDVVIGTCQGYRPYHDTELGKSSIKVGAGFNGFSKISMNPDAVSKVTWPPSYVVTDEIFSRDMDVDTAVKRLQNIADDFSNSAVAYCERELDCTKKCVRTRSCPVGNLIADIMRETFDADIAVFNSGVIGSGEIYEAGMLTAGNIRSILPHGDYITVMNINGAAVTALMTAATSRLPKPDGRFCHVSGIHVSCVVEPLTNYIETIKINKDKIQESSVYRVVVNSYIAEAKPGFSFMSKYYKKFDRSSGVPMRLAVFRYLERKMMHKIDKTNESLDESDFESLKPDIGNRVHWRLAETKESDVLFESSLSMTSIGRQNSLGDDEPDGDNKSVGSMEPVVQEEDDNLDDV